MTQVKANAGGEMEITVKAVGESEEPSVVEGGKFSRPVDFEVSFAVASAARDAPELRALLDAGPSGLVNFIGNDRGKSLLHLAARDGDADKVMLLLSKGAKLNLKSADGGETALHYAAAGGHKAALRVLVRSGATIDAAVPGGWTPLHVAIQCGSRPVVDYLCSNGANIQAATQFKLTPLHLAVWHGHVGITADLLWRGAKTSCKDACGRSPLHLACWNGHHRLTKLLHRYGAKLAAVDAEGNTPMHDAAINNSVECINVMVELDMPSSVKNKAGHTPLHEAVNSGNFAAVKALLRHGRDVNQPTSYGSTPLHLAVALNNADLVRALLEADSINVDLASFDGNTPLHWAVWYGCAEIVELLLRHGADANATDKGGNTALHWAAFKGFTGIAARLLSAAVPSLSIRNEAGKIPMDLAREWSHYECGALLLSAATGEAFTPLVPQRLSSLEEVDNLTLHDELRPVVSYSGQGFQRAGQNMRSYVPQCIIEQEHARSSLVAARNGSLDWMSSMQVPCSRSFTDAPSRLHHHCATPSPGQSSSTPSKPQSTSGSSSAPDAELLVSLTDTSGRAVHILGADDAPLEGRDPGPILAGHATASLDLSAARSPFHPRLHTPASPPYSWTLNQEDLTILHGGECDTRLNVLGRGPWGPVYRGLMHGTDPVAIRKLSLTAAGVQMVGVTDILDQMHRLRHPCLVMFLGAAFIGDEVWVVAEMVDGHTVAAAQRQEGKGPLRWSPCICRAALACARAINYLHRQRPPVVHGNICAESLILEDGSRSGRATSPSRCQDTSAANVGAKLVGWKIMALDKFTDASGEESGLLSVQPAASHAPEFAPGEHLHPSIDIFCLGRLLLYMAGGEVAPRSVSHLAAQCMSSSPCERPCAAQVVRELEEMLQKMTDCVVDS